MLSRKGITITTLEQKRTFNYFITLPNKRKIKGQKLAFNAKELKDAFNKHGYEKVRVEPVLIEYTFKPPIDNILNFINLSSFMLNEEMAYDKILELLSDEEANPTLRSALKTIQSELKKGREGEEVFREQEHVFGKFPAYMLGLATKSGNMADVYTATAKFMERDAEYRRHLRQAFLGPAFTIFVMFVAIGYYLGWVFPATATMFTRFNIDVPPMTAWTMKMSDFMLANWWGIAMVLLIPPLVLGIWFRTSIGSFYRDKWVVKLPSIGPLLHKTSIEIFFRVFSAIYSGAENNIETLRAAAESCRNKWIEHGVKEVAIPMMLRDGASLVPALHASKVFNRNSLNRLKSGAETGNVLASSSQIARFYEQETKYKMINLINSINNYIAIFIGVVITALTIVSSEIAFISPPVYGFG
jgi:type IV pilus assembly protein PilC